MGRILKKVQPYSILYVVSSIISTDTASKPPDEFFSWNKIMIRVARLTLNTLTQILDE